LIRAGVLLALLFASLAARAETSRSASGFDRALTGRVYAAALAFMAPRILEPVPVSQLTLWGLRGLTALDPLLSTEIREGSLVLASGNRLLAAGAPPPGEDEARWGALAAELGEAAWNASPAIRHSGGQEVIQSFFDELFNHLDPYSRYVSPDDAAEDRANRAGTAGPGSPSPRAAAGSWCRERSRAVPER
jgi:carboxyl-terminal processing protease